MAKTPSNPFGIEFGEPPAAPRERVTEDWVGPAELLRQNPGQWAKVKVYDDPKKAQTRAFTFKKGTKAFPEGEFDFRYLGNKENGTSELWACYVGTGNSDAAPSTDEQVAS